MRTSERANAVIRDEAIEWFLSSCEGELSVGDRETFMAWLRKSPQHVEAYLRIMALWEDAETLQAHVRGGLAAVLKQAAEAHNVVSLPTPTNQNGPSASSARSSWAFWRVAAVAATVGVIIVSFIMLTRETTIETGVGEQRTVTLADGSRVELNSRSRLRVRFSGVLRAVDLLEGQALFSVTQDLQRPFLVYSNGTVVRAVGTQFDVNQVHGTSIITVVEGRVAVSDVVQTNRSGTNAAVGDRTSSTPSDPLERTSVLVSSGQRVIASAHVVALPEVTNPALATAWTEGKLIFDSVPLREVVDEFNRYLPRPLVVDDPQLQTLHISGVFSVTESQLFIDFLHHRFGTTSRDDGRNIRIVSP